jgi:hypothetical protein
MMLTDESVEQPKAALSEAEIRQAMRAYLQRAEVRLSTMHRIAGVFINGAGLLVLFPFLFKDVVERVAGILLTNVLTDNILVIAMFSSAGIPFMISLGIPLYALYLLIRDLVYFYFVSYSPGFPGTFYNPRFSLAAIAFPKDEAPEAVTKEIFNLQYTTDLRNFILPLNHNIASYFDEMARDNDDIIPKTRTTSILGNMGILDDLTDDNKQDIKRFNAALGLAGFLDRNLIEEVARLEASLARHAISLRRLVLRYIKALLALIWTTIISFLAITIINSFAAKAISPIVLVLTLSVLYGIWSVATPRIVRLPITWLFENNPNLKPVQDVELVRFERSVQRLCLVGTVASVAVVLSSILVLTGISII